MTIWPEYGNLCKQIIDKANKHGVEDIHKLSGVVLKLRSEVAVLQQVNSLLTNRLTSIERQCCINAQYCRREYVDVIDFPNEVVDADVLEEKVFNIFGKLGCDIPSEQIEACHRISKKRSTVTVKFTNWKDC